MKYLSVCSGIEAASVAWHPLGWEPAAFCEIEPFPSAVLKERYPHVVNYGDFTRLSEPDHPVRSTPIDILVGGTPCQAFSVAGLRRGLADARGGLTLEFVRLAQALRPRWIVWENVPGVLSQDGGRAFGAFLGALGELGYGFAYRVLDAQYARVDGYPYAVPQRRRRVFLVGHSGGDAARAASVLFEPEGVRGHTPPRRASRKGAASDAAGGFEVCGTLSDVAHHGGGLNGQDAYTGRVLPVVPYDLRAQNWDGKDTAPTLTCRLYGGLGAQTRPDRGNMGAVLQPVIPYDLLQITAPQNRQNRDEHSPCHMLARANAAHAAVVQPLAFDARQHDVLIYGDKTGPLDTQGSSIGVCVTGEYTHAAVVTATPAYDPCPTLTSRMQGSTGWAPYNEDAHLVAHAAVVQPAVHFDVYNHKTTGDVCGVVREQHGTNTNAVLQPTMSVRRLTPTECERLQGFPDGWTQVAWKGKAASECPDGPRYKALGNSMACNVMRWIGTRIAMVDAVGGER